MIAFFLDDVVPDWMASWYFIIGMACFASLLVLVPVAVVVFILIRSSRRSDSSAKRPLV
jgi:hypothetical protein